MVMKTRLTMVDQATSGKVMTLQGENSAQEWTRSFNLPPDLIASEPAEARGLSRDAVRLMVSYRVDNRIIHTQFRELGKFLDPGDLLVINTSGTLNAALGATRADGTFVEFHLSTHLPSDLWIVEVRQPMGTTTVPFFNIQAGETLTLPAGATSTLHAPYDRSATGSKRLWIATLHVPGLLQDYLMHYGFPIRYHYVRQEWPSSYYQTVYANEPGSAEMPSAGRAFSAELITHLVSQGVQISPLILHTGVSSLEEHEPPYEEYYRVPLATARAVNNAKSAGKRVLAVGTTVARALETVTDEEGVAHPGEGWTSLVITPTRSIRAMNALFTGFHEPRATHLSILAALAGYEHLQIAYAEALRERYLWHEFGDLHLLFS